MRIPSKREQRTTAAQVFQLQPFLSEHRDCAVGKIEILTPPLTAEQDWFEIYRFGVKKSSEKL